MAKPLTENQKTELQRAIDMAITRIPNSDEALLREDIAAAKAAKDGLAKRYGGFEELPQEIQDYSAYVESGASGYAAGPAFFTALGKDPRFQQLCSDTKADAKYPAGYDALVAAAKELYLDDAAPSRTPTVTNDYVCKQIKDVPKR